MFAKVLIYQRTAIEICSKLLKFCIIITLMTVM